jgi:ABC-2 type transport system permease protein
LKDQNYPKQTLKYLKEELSTLNYKNKEDVSSYISTKTDIEINELLLKYGVNSWQSYIITNNLYDLITQINQSKYGDNTYIDLDTLEKEYNSIIEKFDNDNWKYFVNEELKNTNLDIKLLEDTKKDTTDKLELSNLNKSIETLKVTKETLEYRLSNNVSYERGYLDDTLNQYKMNGSSYINSDINSNSTHEEKYRYNEYKKQFEINKYIFENQVNANKQNDTRGILINSLNDLEIFIIVLIAVVAGLSVAEEFSKGTIKQLLIKPYTRFQVLTAKYISSLTMILVGFISLILMELLVGGILFGFNTLSVPVVIYNFNESMIQTFNVFAYLAIIFINKLPMFILMTTLIFLLSVSTINSAISVSIGIVGYTISTVINNLASYYNVVILKFFPTLNWDLTIYLFGNIPFNKNLNYNLSIWINIIYFIIMLIPIYIIFIKKNIKNV